MTFYFNPDFDAVPQYPWNVTYLSQRDVALTIPIPFVTTPGVSLTAACFAHGRYEDYAAAKCISNLLALGFKRLHVDLYWDAERHVWSLCPVQVPGPIVEDPPPRKPGASSSPSRSTSSASRSTPSPTPSASTSSGGNNKILAGRQLGISTVNTDYRQTAQYVTSHISTATLTVALSTVADSTFAVLPTHTPAGAGEILYSISPYVCSRTPAFDIVDQVLRDFLDTTDNTIEAQLRYIILNIHAAASTIAPESPAREPASEDLPSPSRSLGDVVYDLFSDYLFTPNTLRSQRRDLNSSWYLASEAYEPNSAYFSIDIENGVATTPNGWPSESVMEFQSDNHLRLLVGFGTFDPQMQNYNRARDSHVIFAQGILEDTTSRCIFDANSLSLSSANNSWAVTSLSNLSSTDITDSNYDSPVPVATDLVNCGVSALLNQTLSDVTADENVLPYKEFAYSSIWSWAWGEPRTEKDVNGFRCAVLDPTSQGRWAVRDCSRNFRAACRMGNSPYRWTISEKTNEYANAKGLCTNGSHFDVPQTALENHYLLNAYQQSPLSHRNYPIWIDFNSLDIEYCWVTGRNATCPYQVPTDDSAQIYVPTIAGLIIVIVAGLLVLVKCGANRRNSRRRRRADDGWDYEGVPS